MRFKCVLMWKKCERCVHSSILWQGSEFSVWSHCDVWKLWFSMQPQYVTFGVYSMDTVWYCQPSESVSKLSEWIWNKVIVFFFNGHTVVTLWFSEAKVSWYRNCGHGKSAVWMSMTVFQFHTLIKLWSVHIVILF